MAKIYAVANRKGGVGKTSTVHAIGARMAKNGMKTLFCDLDSQCNLTYSVGGAQSSLTIFDALTGTPAENCLQHVGENLDLLPASPSMVAADTVLTNTGKEYRLREALDPILKNYDAVIVDTPAQLGILTVNALTAANEVVIPVQAEIFSLQALAQLREIIDAVRKYTNPGLRIAGLLVTRYNARTVLSRDMLQNLDDVAAAMDTKVFQTQIRENISLKEADALRVDIFSYAPRSNGAIDYESFINELLSETEA